LSNTDNNKKSSYILSEFKNAPESKSQEMNVENTTKKTTEELESNNQQIGSKAGKELKLNLSNLSKDKDKDFNKIIQKQLDEIKSAQLTSNNLHNNNNHTNSSPCKEDNQIINNISLSIISNFNEVKKISNENSSTIFESFTNTYLTNKYHFAELYVYYSYFITKDRIDKDSFVLSSTVSAPINLVNF